jgi:hypothetical protein
MLHVRTNSTFSSFLLLKWKHKLLHEPCHTEPCHTKHLIQHTSFLEVLTSQYELEWNYFLFPSVPLYQTLITLIHSYQMKQGLGKHIDRSTKLCIFICICSFLGLLPSNNLSKNLKNNRKISAVPFKRSLRCRLTQEQAGLCNKCS